MADEKLVIGSKANAQFADPRYDQSASQRDPGKGDMPEPVAPAPVFPIAPFANTTNGRK